MVFWYAQWHAQPQVIIWVNVYKLFLEHIDLHLHIRLIINLDTLEVVIQQQARIWGGCRVATTPSILRLNCYPHHLLSDLSLDIVRQKTGTCTLF